MPGERFIVGEDAVTSSREELDFGQSCQDINGRIVAGGNHYVSGPDSCTVCLCDEGKPKWCQAVLCAAPKVQLLINILVINYYSFYPTGLQVFQDR